MTLDQYPKWKYHPQKEGLVVFNATEELELGDDWYDNQLIATQAGIQPIKEKVVKEIEPEPEIEEEVVIEEKVTKTKKKK